MKTEKDLTNEYTKKRDAISNLIDVSQHIDPFMYQANITLDANSAMDMMYGQPEATQVLELFDSNPKSKNALSSFHEFVRLLEIDPDPLTGGALMTAIDAGIIKTDALEIICETWDTAILTMLCRAAQEDLIFSTVGGHVCTGQIQSINPNWLTIYNHEGSLSHMIAIARKHIVTICLRDEDE